MKTGQKIAISCGLVFIAVIAIIVADQPIRETRQKESFEKWAELRGSWMSNKQLDDTSFQVTDCSVLGIADLGCFVAAYSNCSPAIIEQTKTTIEGDSISIMARVNQDCNVDLAHDSTLDRFSSQKIGEYVCHDVVLKESRLEFDPCSDGASDEKYGFSIVN